MTALVVTRTGLWVVLLLWPWFCFRFFFTTSFFPFLSLMTTFPILLLLLFLGSGLGFLVLLGATGGPIRTSDCFGCLRC